jgi:hypothetical protein
MVDTAQKILHRKQEAFSCRVNGLFVDWYKQGWEELAGSARNLYTQVGLCEAASSSIRCRILYCSMVGAQSKGVSPVQQIHGVSHSWCLVWNPVRKWILVITQQDGIKHGALSFLGLTPNFICSVIFSFLVREAFCNVIRTNLEWQAEAWGLRVHVFQNNLSID